MSKANESQLINEAQMTRDIGHCWVGREVIHRERLQEDIW